MIFLLQSFFHSNSDDYADHGSGEETNYFLRASSTATATATVAPTMGEKCWDSISEGIEANRRWRFATLPMGAGKKQITS